MSWHTHTHTPTHVYTTQIPTKENAATTYRRKDKNILRCPRHSQHRRQQSICSATADASRDFSASFSISFSFSSSSAQRPPGPVNISRAPISFPSFCLYYFPPFFFLLFFPAEARWCVCCSLPRHFSECFSIICSNFFPFKWTCVCVARRIIQELERQNKIEAD